MPQHRKSEPTRAIRTLNLIALISICGRNRAWEKDQREFETVALETTRSPVAHHESMGDPGTRMLRCMALHRYLSSAAKA
jgi:hypothetical protein